MMTVRTVDYREGMVRILDQTALPREEIYLDIADPETLAEAIMTMKIRGAPAIGIAAAYGVLLALENALAGSESGGGWLFDRSKGAVVVGSRDADHEGLRDALHRAADLMAGTRPTAVNLFWAVERMRAAIGKAPESVEGLSEAVSAEAFAIHEEEMETDERIARTGAQLIEDGMTVLTHCNAGGLATAGYGTALSVIKKASEEGKRVKVFACETRPLLQGSRLTAWELGRAGIEVTVLCEGAAASLFAGGKVDAVITGADRIASNGDTANKIGTLGLAILCERYGRPMYIAAPRSTFDLEAESGLEIPIEYRDEREVLEFGGVRVAPEGVAAYNPAFDITPARLITAIVTDAGLIAPPSPATIEAVLGAGGGRRNGSRDR